MRAVILIAFIAQVHAKEQDQITDQEAEELVNQISQMSNKDADDLVSKVINKLSDRLLQMLPLDDMQTESHLDDTTLGKAGAAAMAPSQPQLMDRRSLAAGLAMAPLVVAGQANAAKLRDDPVVQTADSNAYVAKLVELSKANKAQNDKGRQATQNWNAKRFSIAQVNRIKDLPDRFDGKGKTVWDKQRADYAVLKGSY